MSNAAYEKAKRMKLLENMGEQERRDFINFVEDYLGAYCGGECDEIVNKMGDDEFRDTLIRIKERWRRKRAHKDSLLEEHLEEVTCYT